MPSFYDCLFVFAFLVNASALYTAWLVTPKSKLLPQLLPSKTLWMIRSCFPFSAFLAYSAPNMIVTLTTAILLVAVSNASQIPLTRCLGEDGVLKLAIEIASKEKFWPGLFFRLLPALFYAALALFMFFFFQTSDTWGFWIALGVGLYSLMFVSSRMRMYLRLRKLGKVVSDGR